MQVVILAGGKGERLRPLTNNIPKPMIEVGGKPILFHIIEALPQEITEVYVVVGYHGDVIEKAFASYNKGGKKIMCVKQGIENGTFAALQTVEKFLKGSFLVLNGDSLYSKPDLKELCKNSLSILVRHEDWPSERTAACFFDEKMNLSSIHEKVPNLKYEYANCGAYVLTQAIFSEPITRGPSGESWLSAMVGTLATKSSVQGVVAKQYCTITSIEDIKFCETVIAKFDK